MGFSFAESTGDGTTTSFTFSFVGPGRGYVDVSDVHVFLGAVGAEVETTAFTIDLQNPNTLVFDTAPSDQERILIRRIVPKTAPFADFQRGSTFLEATLDNSFLQQLYAYHEILDGWFPDNWGVNTDIDMRGNDILNADEIEARVLEVTESLLVNGEDFVSYLERAEEAAAEADAVVAVIDEFYGTYYGPLAADPVVDPNGDVPTEGDLYFNTVSKIFRTFDGSVWKPALDPFPVFYDRREYLGSDGPDFDVTYQTPFVKVYVNGHLLLLDEYAENATGVTLTGLAADDEVTLEGFLPYTPTDTLPTDSTGLQVNDTLQWDGTRLVKAVDALRGGVIDIADAATGVTPFSYVNGSGWVALPNDGAGSSNSVPPLGITSIYNNSTARFDWSQLKVGDLYTLRFDIEVTTTSPNQEVVVRMLLAEGVLDIPLTIERTQFKTAGTYPVVGVLSSDMGSLNVRDNPAVLQIKSDGNMNVRINGYRTQLFIRG